MNNLNFSIGNSQSFSEEYCNLIYLLGGILPEKIRLEPRSTRRYSPKRIKIIRIILNHINNNQQTSLSHINIAAACHLTRRAVIDAFKVFEEDGLFEIDHRALSHKTNIYCLGAFFKTREVIYALKNVFKNLYRAFCRTLERAYNAVVERNAVRNSNLNFTLSFDVIKRVVFGTNTNTTLSYTRKIYNKVSSVFVENCISNVLGFKNINNLEEKRREMEKQAWLLSEDGKTWKNQKKAQHASWSLTEKDKEIIKKEPAVSFDAGKISSTLMYERIALCKKESNIHRRLLMYERLKTQVEKASQPFIDMHIINTQKLLGNDDV